MIFFLMSSPTNLLMFPLIIMSILMITSSSSWFSTWLGLEINTLAFITFLFSENNQEISESCMIYFLPQALASSIFILSSFTQMSLSKSPLFPLLLSILMISALSLKLGAAPLHQWFPKISTILSWKSNTILMTIQKIPPLFIISQLNFPSSILLPIISFSAIIGAAGGFNQTNLKTMLAFSSISHLAWMYASFIISPYFWQVYILIYSIILLSLLSILNLFKITTINQMNILDISTLSKISTPMIMLSLGGLPPLTGFFPKWWIISNMNSSLILILLMISALTNLFFYLRISYSSIFLSPSKILTLSKSNFPLSTLPLIFLSTFFLPSGILSSNIIP